jgi:hypothetical protein
MTDDRSLERAARSWLEAGPTQAPDRAMEAALLRIQTTPQERDLRIPWRLPKMTTPARVAAAAVIGVLAIGGALFVFRPGGSSVGGPGPTPRSTSSPTMSPVPSPSPMTLMEGVEIRPLVPGLYVSTPFSEPGSDWCFDVPAPFPSIDPSGCTDTKSDDSIRFTFVVPAGWARVGSGVWPEKETSLSPGGAGLNFGRGSWLHADPCLTDQRVQKDSAPPDIKVGPTVDDFATAIEDHPLLDATAPVDVMLAGYSGKYMELRLPADLSGCQTYYPWEPWGIYAQGPGNRWKLWILDVDGVRVVVQTAGYATTSAQHQAELQAIVDSIKIES